MKTCSTCGVDKPLDAFHRRSTAPDGRQNRCKQCYVEQYRREGHQLREKVRARDVPLREHKLQQMAQYLEDHPCVDCGQDDLRVLDFDHRDRAAKRYGIGPMLLGGWTWRAVLAEIEKCDVRCANCHRKRTAEQFGWWRQSAQLARRASETETSRRRLAALFT